MNRADQLQTSDPQAATAMGVGEGRRGDHPVSHHGCPSSSLNFADFTSAQVGNYQDNPMWGILLDQLWVR